MSILKFFVRAVAVVPEELSRYISKNRGEKSSITPNRGAVCSKKTPVKMMGDIRLEKENHIENRGKSSPSKIADDGPII